MMRKKAWIYVTVVGLITWMIAGCSESPNERNQAIEENNLSDLTDETNEVDGPVSDEVSESVDQFDRVSRHFIDGLMEVEVHTDAGALKGFINDLGEIIVSPEYEETKFYIGVSSASSGFSEGLAPVKKSGKWGYINLRGETVIDFIYDDADLFMNNRAAVMVDEKYGLIDSRGEWVVTPTYDQIWMVNGVGVVQLDDQSGFINVDGRVLVEPTYDFVDIQNAIDYGTPYVYTYKGDLVGVIKIEDGEVSTIVQPTYTKVHPFRDGLAQFVIAHLDDEGNFHNDITVGYIDETGEEILKWEHFAYELGALSEGKVALQNEQGKWGYVDLDKNVVIPFQYDEAGSFYDGLAIVTVDDQKGAIDAAGNWILEPHYRDIVPLDSYFIVRDDEGQYLLSKDTSTKMSNVYDDIGRGGDLWPVKKDDKIGFIDETGKEVIPLIYDECYTFAFWEGYAAVRIQDEWFYIDAQGNRLGETTFDEVGLFHDGYAKVREDGKWGVVDQTQQIVVPIQYDDVTVYNDGLILLNKDGKYEVDLIKN